ncbi:MAG: DUF447 domain-containing protein [Candidatus Hermodarchaeota archaeon]
MMKINHNDIGLQKNYLFEVLATTFKKVEDKVIPNTASMGIRLINDDIITITPYPNTTTFKNLQLNGFASVNFVDNVYLYCLASLKDPNLDIGLKEFPTEYYGYYEFTNEKGIKGLKNRDIITFPYIKQAWAIAFCEVIEESKIIKENSLGKLRVSEFKLRIYSIVKRRESFKLFNRAENLILEILILATRLKVAKDKKDQQLFNSVHNKIIDLKQSIERFTKNENVIKSLDLISKYTDRLLD